MMVIVASQVQACKRVRFKIGASGSPQQNAPRRARPQDVTPARQGLAMVAQWFYRRAEAEGVDGLPQK